MILHCTPPYNQHIPNPALGYLKGFLESRGIKVKNVYWNLILADFLSQFQKGLKDYSESKDFLPIIPTIYLCRQLLSRKFEKVTPVDYLYLSIYSEEELVEMVHSVKDRINQYIRQNALHEAALTGFTLKSYQWPMAYYIADRLKEMNPDTKVVIGGITSKSQALAFARIFTSADFAIWGEGEYPLFYLDKAVQEGTSYTKIPDLIYRDGNTARSTGHTLAPDAYPPLDSYPFADHSDYVQAFNTYMRGDVLSAYLLLFGRHVFDKTPIIIPIWGSRSCPWNRCKFCVLNEEYVYRTRSPENIVEEIEYQSAQYQVDSFIFVDTELPGNLKRFKTLLKLLMQSSAHQEKKYRFFAEVSPLFIDPETAQYMQLASFSEIQIGFEAVTDSLLEKMDKRHRFPHNIQALKLGTQYGLNMQGLNILRGIPTETKDDILESCSNLKFLRFFLNTYSLSPRFLRLDKGAPFYEVVSEDENKIWKNSPVWAELEPARLVSESERFELFGFCKQGQDRLWADFEHLLTFYTQQDRSYDWVEYPQGSFIEERGLRLYKYLFDRDETDLLVFCDTIKSLSDVKKRFPHLSDEHLFEMLYTLKEAGMLYYDKDMRWIISVLEAGKRRTLVIEAAQ